MDRSVEGERLAEVREGELPEASEYATSRVEELELEQQSQTDTREADPEIVRVLWMKMATLTSSTSVLDAQLDSVVKRWG